MMLTILLGLTPNLLAPPAPLPLLLEPTPPILVQEADEVDPRTGIIEYYVPRRADPHTLQNIMQQIAGDALVHERLVGTSSTTSRPDFRVYGDSLLVIDTRAGMAETLALMQTLDERYKQGQGLEREQEPTQLFQYSVTHVGMDAVQRALYGLFPSVPTQAGVPSTLQPQLSFVEESNLVLVRGTLEQITEAETILKALDVPKPRVMLSFFLIAGAESNDPRVPADLAKDLTELVPYAGFQLLSSAILPSDTTGEVRLTVVLDEGRGELELRMKPVAYDKTAGILALGNVDVDLALSDDDGNRQRKSFRTSTSLEKNRYTVLGAVGADPVFMVIRMTPGR